MRPTKNRSLNSWIFSSLLTVQGLFVNKDALRRKVHKLENDNDNLRTDIADSKKQIEDNWERIYNELIEQGDQERNLWEGLKKSGNT